MTEPTETRRRYALAQLRGQNNEGVLLGILILLIVVMAIVNPSFLGAGTAFSIIRNSLVSLVFALGVLVVIVSGGFDVSFPIIAIFSAYTTVVISEATGMDLSAWQAFGVAAVIGVALGLVNGAIIALFRLPTLIVTLGTQGIFWGFLLAYVGSEYIPNLPSGLAALSTANIMSVQSGRSTVQLHAFIIPVVFLCLLMSWLLRRTMFGRSVYALGGDIESARRVGIPVVRMQLTIYGLMGVLASTAGIMHITLARMANPYDLVGSELDIIAAVVLGGAAVMGGRGSVSGTVIGVVLISVIQSSLILMGVPGAWQRAAVGLLLIAGVSVQAVAAHRRKSGLPSELQQKHEVAA